VTWPAIYVEAAFGANLQDGINTYTWTDISYACPGFTVSSPSRDRFTDAHNPGTATFTFDNSTRLFDPFATSGAYTSGGVSLVRPNLPIRVRVVYSGIPYFLFTGYVDTIDVEWNDPGDSVTTITATDGFKLLANRAVPPQTLPTDKTGARIVDIVDAVDWDQSILIDDGLSRMIARKIEGSSNALSEMQLAEEHEHGLLYMDGEGRLTFRTRDWPYVTTSWTLSDAGGGALEYTDLRIRSDLDTAVNYATQGNSWSTNTYSASDITSASNYWWLDAQRFDWEYEWDTEVEVWVSALVSIYANLVSRFDALTTNPAVDDALWPFTLQALLGQRVSVTRTPPGGGSAITRTCFISGRTDTVRTLGADSQGSWETVWKLDDATSWPALTPAEWGAGVWGTAKWFY
jgi:hypothetical protein